LQSAGEQLPVSASGIDPDPARARCISPRRGIGVALRTAHPSRGIATDQVKRVLIYRLGSIGDFVVALPCLHLVRACFPFAEIRLLTNRPIEHRAAPASSILEGTDLVDGYFEYPAGTQDPRDIVTLFKVLRAFRPDLLVYLTERRSALAVYRDYLFFRLCGVRNSVGMPFTQDLRAPRLMAPEADLWEPEAQRLGRCLKDLGTIDWDRAENWSLHLSGREEAKADRQIAERMVDTPAAIRLLGLGIGTKQAIKDWGDANWRRVLTGLRLSNFALVLVGSAEDRDRSERLAFGWPGPVLNFCGELSPRLSAAVIRRAALFLCNDSGPMHLAAAVGTRCVAVFSNKDAPGWWSPCGANHVILRPPSRTDPIQAVDASRVIGAVSRVLREC